MMMPAPLKGAQKMQNDRMITISTGGSRQALHWQTESLLWSSFVDRIRQPKRSVETLTMYLSMSKAEQDRLKDVGGFVGGKLKGERRKADQVLFRDLIALDLDQIPAGGTQDIQGRVEELGCAAALYSTRKHRPAEPRLRILLPTNRSMTPDEYEPCARKAAELIGLSFCDPTTFEISRLMYWPSCCADAQYVFWAHDKPFVDVDGLLNRYENWKDVSQWPVVEGETKKIQRSAVKQGDPTEKPGSIGAFCRIYDVPDAIETFLSDVYTPSALPGRYSFAGGSTSGGAVLYNDGAFLYSHHASDPAGGRLCNAFDLVRLHLFGEEDANAEPNTPETRLPSQEAMGRFALEHEAVRRDLNRQRQEEAEQSFGDFMDSIPIESADADNSEETDFLDKLDLHPRTGDVKPTVDNILLILKHDPKLKGKIVLDEFSHRRLLRGQVPWERSGSDRRWSDADDAGLRWYLERSYRVSATAKTDDALAIISNHNRIHVVRDYLKRLAWDEADRADTFFIDYLGAEDTPYVRMATRKFLVAAVARVMRPGCKFDNMLIPNGPQGIGKSTAVRKLGMGWFNDNIRTFEGKELLEAILGSWIIEVSELDAMNKSEVERVKQVLSQQEDVQRMAYARHAEEYLRQCVFIGTSNQKHFLRDMTGGRRFWPIDVGVVAPKLSVFDDLDPPTVDQIWAEAVLRFEQGETLYLPRDIEEAARQEQEAHREESPREGAIRAFVEKEVPLDWQKMSLEERKLFWQTEDIGEAETRPRDRICAQEIWCECLGGDLKFMKRMDAMEINGILSMLAGWKRTKSGAQMGAGYGYQKGFLRVGSTKTLS